MLYHSLQNASQAANAMHLSICKAVLVSERRFYTALRTFSYPNSPNLSRLIKYILPFLLL